MRDKSTVKVGIGVMILKNGKVLLGKRKGSHGEGEYAFPGGHFEFGESFEECAKRETLEETGMKIKNVRFLLLSNIKTWSKKHYVHIGLIADWERGLPEIKEQNKTEGWEWYGLNNLPEPLFLPCRQAIDAYNGRSNYLDS